MTSFFNVHPSPLQNKYANRAVNVAVNILENLQIYTDDAIVQLVQCFVYYQQWLFSFQPICFSNNTRIQSGDSRFGELKACNQWIIKQNPSYKMPNIAPKAEPVLTIQFAMKFSPHLQTIIIKFTKSRFIFYFLLLTVKIQFESSTTTITITLKIPPRVCVYLQSY